MPPESNGNGLTIKEMLMELRTEVKQIRQDAEEYRRTADYNASRIETLDRKANGHQKTLYGEKGDNGLQGDMTKIKAIVGSIVIIGGIGSPLLAWLL